MYEHFITARMKSGPENRSNWVESTKHLPTLYVSACVSVWVSCEQCSIARCRGFFSSLLCTQYFHIPKRFKWPLLSNSILLPCHFRYLLLLLPILFSFSLVRVCPRFGISSQHQRFDASPYSALMSREKKVHGAQYEWFQFQFKPQIERQIDIFMHYIVFAVCKRSFWIRNDEIVLWGKLPALRLFFFYSIHSTQFVIINIETRNQKIQTVKRCKQVSLRETAENYVCIQCFVNPIA